MGLVRETSVELNFGKNAGKSVEQLVLKDPKYIHWMLSQSDAKGALKLAQAHAAKCIKRFDAKPFVKTCSGQNCHATATRCTVYTDNVSDPYWWCDTCDPYESGANRGKLPVLTTYAQAYNHVQLYCSGRVSDHKDIVLSMAKAKGLPSRVGEAQALQFFA